MNFPISAKTDQHNRLFTILLFMLIVSVLSAGCSKGDDGSSPGDGGDHYMKFTINGVTKEYRGNTLAQFTNPGYDASMVALKDATDFSANTMSVVLSSETPFATNATYTEAFTATGDIGAFLIYIDELGNIFTSLGSTLAPDAKVTVQFTFIADSYVKGNFSGKLYEDAFTSAAYTVTNGSFYLKRE